MRDLAPWLLLAVVWIYSWWRAWRDTKRHYARIDAYNQYIRGHMKL